MTEKTKKNKRKTKGDPPGKAKLVNALRTLLKKKDFASITTAKLAKTAGVNEALIYRYFNSKRGLLHQVTEDYLKESNKAFRKELKDIAGAKERLRCFIANTFRTYEKNYVFAKIILLEARNFPGFFKSLSYDFVKDYSNILMEIIQEGVAEGVFRNDMEPRFIRDFIIGTIEHYIMPDVLFNRKSNPDLYTENICKIAFKGIV